MNGIISAEVKAYFKNTIHEKEAPINASKKAFLVKMSEKWEKQCIPNYECMLFKEHKKLRKCAITTVHMYIQAWKASCLARSERITNTVFHDCYMDSTTDRTCFGVLIKDCYLYNFLEMECLDFKDRFKLYELNMLDVPLLSSWVL